MAIINASDVDAGKYQDQIMEQRKHRLALPALWEAWQADKTPETKRSYIDAWTAANPDLPFPYLDVMRLPATKPVSIMLRRCQAQDGLGAPAYFRRG